MSDQYGQNIKALRESLGISQRAFARQIFCDQSTLAKKETGERSIFLHEIPVLMEALQIDDANLLLRSVTPKANDTAGTRKDD
jgi:transcriptional regulator with XRE-family HTH domain